MVPAHRTAAAEEFDARNVTVQFFETVTRFPWLLAMLAEWAVDNLLDACALALKSIPRWLSAGLPYWLGCNCPVHAGLRVQQVEEVVKVLNSTSLKRFVDVLLCQRVKLHP